MPITNHRYGVRTSKSCSRKSQITCNKIIHFQSPQNHTTLHQKMIVAHVLRKSSSSMLASTRRWHIYLSIYLSMQQSNFTKLHDCNFNSIWRMCKRGDMLRCLPNCVLLASQRSSQPCVCIAKPSTWDVETCQRFFWGGNMYHQYGRPIHVHKLHCIIPKRV